MRILVISILIILIAFIAFQDYRFYRDWRDAKEEFAAIKDKLDIIQKDNKKIEEDLLYFQSSENLEKEARSVLNYKKPGEKVIVIVPEE